MRISVANPAPVPQAIPPAGGRGEVRIDGESGTVGAGVSAAAAVRPSAKGFAQRDSEPDAFHKGSIACVSGVMATEYRTPSTPW